MARISSIGVYIHIPFCRSKCYYCDFCSTASFDDKLMDEYLDAILIQLGDFFTQGSKHNVDTIYIGGGTPSVFGEHRLEKILSFLSKRAVISKTAEITVELNPESVTKKLLGTLKKCGVNRLSLGVQSTDDQMLHSIGRIHTYEQAKEAVELCREYCTDNISLDLMYGLPGQTMLDWARSIEGIALLRPKHISCYGLKLEEGTPLYIKQPTLPDDDQQADMYLYAVRRLGELGFEQYEISNFARDRLVSKHNSRYWDLREYVGFGCGAHSYCGGKRYSFIKNIEEFINCIKTNKPVVDEGDEWAFTARSGEYVMLKLRTAEGIDESEFYRLFKLDFSQYADRLIKYIDSGHVLNNAGRWRLTPEGFLISNTILCDVLDESQEAFC